MQNKLTYIYLCLLLLIISSCHKSDDYNNISDDYLKSLTTNNGYYVDVVIPIKEDKMVILVTPILLYTYEQHYQAEYSTDFDFLRALFDGKIQDIDQYLNDYTKVDIDISIMKEYKKYGIKYIIDKYLVGTDNEYYTFKEWVNLTVVKIMFINNYYLYYDDHVPTFVFKSKLDNLAIPENW